MKTRELNTLTSVKESYDHPLAQFVKRKINY